jgi:hypothetical protein
VSDDTENERDDEQQRLITEAINRWLANHEPLPRAEFDRINSALVRTVGEPVDHPTQVRNVRFREADAEAFGEFACEYDVALAEFDDDARYADLHGYPVAEGAGWVPILVTTDDSGGVTDAARRIHDSYHAAETVVGDNLSRSRRVVTDGGQPMCGTLGCDNEPVVDGYCRECADISPGILDSDDGGGAPGEGHRASAVSDEADEPESDTDESTDSGSHNPVEDSSDDASPGFEAGEPAARKHPDHEQSRAAVASPQHAPDERGRKGGPR